MSPRRSAENYREYLVRELEDRGLRQFNLAELVGMSRAWVSQIVNGRRSLQPELAEAIADALELPDRRRIEFLSLVDREVGNSSIVRRRAQDLLGSLAQPEPAEITDPTFRKSLDEWYVGAILELARCEDYVPEPSWVGATLRPRIREELARDAMEHLRDSGYLDAGFRLVEESGNVGTEREVGGPESQNVTKLHLDTLEMARNALLKTPHTDRLFGCATLALSEDAFETFRGRLEELLATTILSVDQTGANRVYHVNVAAFPVSLYSDSAVDPRTLVDDEDP